MGYMRDHEQDTYEIFWVWRKSDGCALRVLVSEEVRYDVRIRDSG